MSAAFAPAIAIRSKRDAHRVGVGGAMGTAWCIGAVADDSAEIDARVECAEGFIVFPGLGALIGLACGRPDSWESAGSLPSVAASRGLTCEPDGRAVCFRHAREVWRIAYLLNGASVGEERKWYG